MKVSPGQAYRLRPAGFGSRSLQFEPRAPTPATIMATTMITAMRMSQREPGRAVVSAIAFDPLVDPCAIGAAGVVPTLANAPGHSTVGATISSVATDSVETTTGAVVARARRGGSCGAV